ncbi:MAG TPA: hypothetical protein VFQ61_09025 [Polyangiaceae bacterium]|nr:hypothetical protein [Polyangiaceae bacterium]
MPRGIMLSSPDTSAWQFVGRTANSRYFAVEPGILACVPDPKSADTEGSAKENVRFQELYWTERAEHGTCIVYFDQLVDQTAAARRVYATYPFRSQLATALLGGTALSRAIASFFTGLSQPATRTKFFGSYADAADWCRSVLREEQASP